MAYKTGTATDHLDLWSTLLDFLQNDATLVAAGQAWTVVWQAPSGAPNETDVLLKGPGLSGTDEVYVGLSRTDDELTAGESVVYISGATGVLAGATSFIGHVNSLSHPPCAFLDHAPMQYWMVANGRRFVVVVKISTVYQAIYGGFFLPYATPQQYGLPMFVGGTRGYSTTNSGYQPPSSWRSTVNDAYRHFIYPFAYSGRVDTQGFMLAPDGTWLGLTCVPDSSQDGFDNLPLIPNFNRALIGPRAYPRAFDGLYSDQYGDFYGRFSLQYMVSFGYYDVLSLLAPGLDGEVALTRATLMQGDDDSNPNTATFGVLDGCYSINGAGQSVENIITVGGVDHLVIQNVTRTATPEYWALALE